MYSMFIPGPLSQSRYVHGHGRDTTPLPARYAYRLTHSSDSHPYASPSGSHTHHPSAAAASRTSTHSSATLPHFLYESDHAASWAASWLTPWTDVGRVVAPAYETTRHRSPSVTTW